VILNFETNSKEPDQNQLFKHYITYYINYIWNMYMNKNLIETYFYKIVTIEQHNNIW